MLALDDPRWSTLPGGYRTPYDATRALKSLTQGGDPRTVWKELWEELHHQGDVGWASYAAIPYLVAICRDRQLFDWNLFALASIVEVCRHYPRNPPLPAWLADSYSDAWRELFDFGLDALRAANDALLVQSVLGMIALHKGLAKLGAVLTMADASEIDETYQQYHSAT